MAINEATAVKVERDIFEHLEYLKKEKGLTDEKWGESAFQGSINGRRKIQNLKKPQSNGQTQKLSVSDFIRLCEPLGVDPVRVLSKALEGNSL